jgi:Caspase domain
MANQACISIGINQYQFFQPLGYGMEDAVAIGQFFIDAAGWNPQQCLLLSDSSPMLGGRSTYPDRENINRWLKQWCQETLVAGDLLWIFFSGHGISTGGEDYLVPIDGNADDLLNTCISIRQLYQQLASLGFNVLVFIDGNRVGGVSLGEGIGKVTTQLARQYKITTFLSSQSHELSHESSGLGHGLFTTALLEALNYHHDLNIDILESYISTRIPELSEHHWKPVQTLVTILPDGISPFRPIFSATTQSAISATPEFSYSPPTTPQLGYDDSAFFTPPIMSLVDRNVPPTTAITKITEPEYDENPLSNLVKIGFLMAIILGAGGGIYAFQSFSSPASNEPATVRTEQK